MHLNLLTCCNTKKVRLTVLNMWQVRSMSALMKLDIWSLLFTNLSSYPGTTFKHCQQWPAIHHLYSHIKNFPKVWNVKYIKSAIFIKKCRSTSHTKHVYKTRHDVLFWIELFNTLKILIIIKSMFVFLLQISFCGVFEILRTNTKNKVIF